MSGRRIFVPGRSGARPRVLVVGCGFIGSHVVAHLAAAGRSTRVLTRARPADSALDGCDDVELVTGDASDLDACERALEGIDHVVFCAGGLLPAHAELQPELDARLTIGPVATILEALRRRPGTTLVYLSSGGTVYGDPEVSPTGEDHSTAPLGAYGRVRLECERLIARHRVDHGLQARILRCSSVYGEHQLPDRGQGAIVTFLRRVEREQPIFVYGDGLDTRDYVYAGDVAEVVVGLVGRAGGPPLLNVGSGCATSVRELIALVEAQVGRPALVVAQPSRPFDVRHIVLDTRRLGDLIRFAPTELRAGIDRTHRWLAATASPAYLEQAS